MMRVKPKVSSEQWYAKLIIVDQGFYAIGRGSMLVQTN
jgi:hypothetical protein